MESVSMSKNKFGKLEPLLLPDGIHNTESDLFHYRYRNKDMILKKLYFTVGNIFGNKLYTIEALSSNASLIPDYFILPEFWVSINKKIEAFVMKYVPGTNLSVFLKDPFVDYEDKKYYLKRVGKILEHMKSIRSFTTLTDFYLGDLHEDNFIIDKVNREIYVADMDSCKIDNNMSCPARYLTSRALLNNVTGKYNLNNASNALGRYVIDENTDLYCYVIMILTYLYGEKINDMDLSSFYEYLNYLDSLKIDHNLLDCFDRIVTNGDNKNPADYIDTLTAKQIGMARSRVYKKMK